MTRFALLLAFSSLTYAAHPYQAERVVDHGVEVIRLSDSIHQTQVSIAPSFGNRVYELSVHGKNLLYFPLPDAAALKNSHPPAFNAIPFLAPWANRIAGGGFWANGNRYLFNPDIGSVHIDSRGIAIHGMLASSPLWEVTALTADAHSAHLTSRLAFWRYPDLMANWPFAHEYEITYTLAGGVLEVSTTVKNLSAAPMPIVLGFHPYFNIPGVPRSQTSAHLPVRQHVEANADLVATGELTPANLPDWLSLNDHKLDDGFTDLIRDSNGQATFALRAGNQQIEVVYGPKYQVAVVYAPRGTDYVCFEPMTAITNGINLAHDGKYPALQTVAPGATWSENFWIRPSGF